MKTYTKAEWLALAPYERHCRYHKLVPARMCSGLYDCKRCEFDQMIADHNWANACEGPDN